MTEVCRDELLRGVLVEFPETRLRVSGRCMEPAVREGETALLWSAGRRPPRLGDIVLVRTAAGLRLHRLVASLPGLGALTRADAGLDFDARPLELLATVVGVAEDPGRRLRRPLRALRSAAGALARAAGRRLGGSRFAGAR
ncbi:MAG: S24/S26 family peptidase [Vicinamibacteria bacterium]